MGVQWVRLISIASVSAGIALLSFYSSSEAQHNPNRNEARKQCESHDANERIVGCTVVINAKGFGSKFELATAYDARCWAFNDLQQYERGLADCKAAVSLAPQYYYGHLNLANSLIGLGQISNGIAEFTKAIELKPSLPHAYWGRGRAFASLGNKDLARKDFEYVLSIQPTNEEVRQAIAALDSSPPTQEIRPEAAPPRPAFAYSVTGATLGSRFNPDDKAYKGYKCSDTQGFYGKEFDGFTWCRKVENDSEKRGSFKAWYSILHSRDGTIVYVNRSQEPAYWDDDEIDGDIKYYSKRIGASPTRTIPMPNRKGFSEGKIAIWGDVVLDPIVDPQQLKLLAAEKNPNIGILIDFIGDYAKSAKNDLPVYRISGGAGFVWSGTNLHGRGSLRFLAINPSAFYAPSQPPPSSPPTPPQSRRPDGDTYSTIGFWTVTHGIVGNLSGCDASSTFQDKTLFEMALVRSDASDAEWVIFLSNPRWNEWVSKKRQHTLRLVTTKNWQGDFSVNDSNSLWKGGLSTDFMNTVADASSIEIMSSDNNPLTSLDMTDSAAAIRAVMNCVREHPPQVTAVAPAAATTPAPAPVPAPPKVSSGTGFFVSSEGHILTNHHVVEGCRNITASKGGRITRFASDEASDLALLMSSEKPRYWASLLGGRGSRVAEAVMTIGFPLKGLLSSDPIVTTGIISALSGIKSDRRFIQMTAPVQPGNSGGPLVDLSNGAVVGVVSGKLNALKIAEVIGDIPQNINFAVSLGTVQSFLNTHGVPYVLDDTTNTKSYADIAAEAMRYTVLLECSR